MRVTACHCLKGDRQGGNSVGVRWRERKRVENNLALSGNISLCSFVLTSVPPSSRFSVLPTLPLSVRPYVPPSLPPSLPLSLPPSPSPQNGGAHVRDSLTPSSFPRKKCREWPYLPLRCAPLGPESGILTRTLPSPLCPIETPLHCLS